MPAEVQRSVVPRIGTLIDKARASGVLVIYIQHDGPKGHPLETHTQSWEICPLLKPADGEQVIRKRESDSFFETPLQRELEKRGIAHLIIAGGMTEYCVDTTCRRAASVGYDVTLAGDAHFTRDNEVLTAKNIIAHHNFVLDGFGAGDHLVFAQWTQPSRCSGRACRAGFEAALGRFLCKHWQTYLRPCHFAQIAGL